jgi:hypothetical protein
MQLHDAAQLEAPHTANSRFKTFNSLQAFRELEEATLIRLKGENFFDKGNSARRAVRDVQKNREISKIGTVEVHIAFTRYQHVGSYSRR